jgi:hypothetical protein
LIFQYKTKKLNQRQYILYPLFTEDADDSSCERFTSTPGVLSSGKSAKSFWHFENILLQLAPPMDRILKLLVPNLTKGCFIPHLSVKKLFNLLIASSRAFTLGRHRERKWRKCPHFSMRVSDPVYLMLQSMCIDISN